MKHTHLRVRHCLTSALAFWTLAVSLAVSLAAADTTSSPYAPSTPNDHTFVRNGGPNLDVSCATYEEGALTIQLPVSRFVGATNPDGTLAESDKAIRGGTLAPVAKLRIAFRQERFNTLPPNFPQRDLVSFNGTRVDQLERENSPYLNGERDVWRINTFAIPIGRVRFPSAKGVNGAPPVPADNSVTIDIDTLNAEYGADDWCTKLDWVELTIHAASPVILIHGIHAIGEFFVDHGFATDLRNRGFILDKTIALGPDRVADNAALLDISVPTIVTGFGVDSIHIVAHSKGGLDARAYLAQFQPAHDTAFSVLSYTTLSTPHNGSVLADLVVKRFDEPKHNLVRFPAYPALTGALLAISRFDEGYRDLVPEACAMFNRRTLPQLPWTTTYFAIAADADLDGNARIDNEPDEYAALRLDSDQLAGIYSTPALGGRFWARLIVDTLYQILRKVPGVTIVHETRIIHGIPETVAVFRSTGHVDLGNDTLVTTPSGIGIGSFLSKTTNTFTFTGTMGRNHSSIADPGVAGVVAPWIIAVETARGDLAPTVPR